ncbi:MAG TPA: cytochrome c family protein [Geminicoccaceae bacterium]|nr:cytochrome c family protein [Geminicoccus sp.]HMU52478.1 cytochrome c family protein [Geminicoccaceae bacterium]
MAASLEGNKLFAAILTAGIIASGSGVLSRMVYGPHHLEEPAFRIALPEGGGEGTAAPAAEEKPLAVLLASADPAAGANVAKKCAACHSFEKGGPNKVGPDLWGVVDREVGKHEGFSYSPAMAGHGGNWTFDDLNDFLKSPKTHVPGTKMAFAGLPKETDRADVIVYLRSLADSPVPLPEAPAGEAPADAAPAGEAPAPQSGG